MATLRQIFTKMANDVKKYPNIVQLTKTLDEGFKEVAENISGGGGGGSTVSVTQTQTSGNKIGTVTVDGAGTDLYAPKATLSLSGTGNRTLNLNTQVTGSVDVSAVDLPVGDTVSVNAIQTTGTTIAEITVNNVTTQIKSPTTTGIIYATTEHAIGKWLNDETIYARSYVATISSGTQWIDTDLDSTYTIIGDEGVLQQTNGDILILPSGDSSVIAGINSFSIGIVTPDKWSCLFRTTNNDARGSLTLTVKYIK